MKKRICILMLCLIMMFSFATTSFAMIPTDTDGRIAPSTSDKAMTMSSSSLTKAQGEKVTLSVSGASSVEWKASDTRAARVTSHGTSATIEILKSTGNVNIIATELKNGRTTSKNVKCKITMQKAPTDKSISIKSNGKVVTSEVLAKGGSLNLSVSYEKGYSGKYSWSSSNEKVAKVSTSGKVTGLAAGTATITCKTFNNVSKLCKITVKGDITANDMTVPGSIILGTKETYKIEPKYDSSIFKPSFTFASEDKKIATVDSKGKVTGQGVGETNITISSGKTLLKKVAVTVKKSPGNFNLTPPSTYFNLKKHTDKNGKIFYATDEIYIPINYISRSTGEFSGKITWKITSGSKYVDIISSDNYGIKLVGVKEGKVAIKATAYTGKSASTTIIIKKI